MAVAVSGATLPAPAAQAQDKRTRARAELLAGSNALQQGDYAGALGHFEKAYEFVPSPKILYNFGLAYLGLDRPSEAMRAFQTFVDEAQDAPAPNIAKAREYIPKLLKRVAVIELDGDLTNAEVSVDGRSFGSSAKLVVDPGPHQITVDKPGKQPFLQRLSTGAGARVRLPVLFQEYGAPAQPPPQPIITTQPSTPSAGYSPPPLASRTGPQEDSRDEVATPRRGSGPAWQHTAGWVSAGVGAALLGAGLVTFLLANQRYADYNETSTNRRDSLGNPIVDKATGVAEKCNIQIQVPRDGSDLCQKLRSEGDTFRTMYLVGFIGGAVAAGASAFFFLTEPTPGRSERAMTCAPMLGVAGASCRFTF
jgi:hypothetical protein